MFRDSFKIFWGVLRVCYSRCFLCFFFKFSFFEVFGFLRVTRLFRGF